MKLQYKTKRILSLFVLLVILPIYVVVAVTIINMFQRMPIFFEFIIYILLGIVWALPLKFIFKGVGKENPKKHD